MEVSHTEIIRKSGRRTHRSGRLIKAYNATKMACQQTKSAGTKLLLKSACQSLRPSMIFLLKAIKKQEQEESEKRLTSNGEFPLQGETQQYDQEL